MGRIRRGLTLGAAVVGGATALALGARELRIAQLRAANAIPDPDGLEWSGFIDVRGTRQWLLVRGHHRSSEVVLFLHGGPGFPITDLAGSRYQGALEERFLVVHWEQRGAGKSYRAGLAEPLSLETYLADALAVTDHLRATFGREKIFLVGHSHGAFLGAHLAARAPERYHAFVGVGQLVDATRQEQRSYAYVRDFFARRGDRRAVAELDRLGPPPYADTYRGVMAERRLLVRTPGFSGPRYPLHRAAAGLLTCPYYGLGDVLNWYRGTQLSLQQHFTPEYWSLDLNRTHRTFSIPVFIVMGANDQNTPTSIAREYFEALQAPRKELVIIEDAGHMVFFEAPERFNRELLRLLSGIAAPR